MSWLQAAEFPQDPCVLVPCMTPGCTDLAFLSQDNDGEETMICDACQEWRDWH